MDKKKSFSVGEIARICQVTPTTVYRWIIEGKLKSFKTVGGHNRVWKEDSLHLFNTLKIPQHRHDTATSQTLKILIVDDDPAIRRLIKRILHKGIPEAALSEAADGYEVGYLIRDQRPALVVLDLVLPGIDGIRVCQSIKSNKELKSTIVVAITGQLQENTRKKVLRAGADSFFTLPFDHKDFLRTIKHHLFPSDMGK